MFGKYIADPSHVLKALDIELREDLSYIEQQVQILDCEKRVLHNEDMLRSYIMQLKGR